MLVCVDPACEPCVAQRLFEADRVNRSQALTEDLHTIGRALTAPARRLLALLSGS